MMHAIAHYLSDQVFSSGLFLPFFVLAVLLFWLRTWLGGTTNTWEREWRGKRVIVVGPPTALTLALLEHLASLSAPTLYLPPALTPSLLTLLAAIRLRAPAALDGADEVLTAEAVDPRDKQQVLAFVRAWANREDGVSGTGKRVDAVVWAYGAGTVDHPALLVEDAQSTTRSSRAGVEAMTRAEEERARFLFFTAFLPQILHAVQASAIKSLRIVALIDPIYPAGFKTSPLLVPNSPLAAPSPPADTDATSSTFKDPSSAPAPSAAAPSAAAPTPLLATKPPSDAVKRAHHALRTIVFVSHFQRILNALSLKNEALSSIPLPSAESAQAASVAQRDEKEEPLPEAKPADKEERRSAVLVAAVSPGWHFASVLRPFLYHQSPKSLVVPTLWNATLPLRLLVGPSSHRCVQSVLFALSAPPEAVGWGSVIKDCLRIWVPPALTLDEKLGRQVWEEVEGSLLDRPSAAGAEAESAEAK